MRCLAYYVTHLKAVKGDEHAIKNLDRELECKTCCLAKAAGVEAVVPCKCAPHVAFYHVTVHILHCSSGSSLGNYISAFLYTNDLSTKDCCIGVWLVEDSKLLFLGVLLF